jgi:hypothetical protein
LYASRANDQTKEPGNPTAQHAAEAALSPHLNGGWAGEHSTCQVVDGGIGGIDDSCVVARAGIVGCAKLVYSGNGGAANRVGVCTQKRQGAGAKDPDLSLESEGEV